MEENKKGIAGYLFEGVFNSVEVYDQMKDKEGFVPLYFHEKNPIEENSVSDEAIKRIQAKIKVIEEERGALMEDYKIEKEEECRGLIALERTEKLFQIRGLKDVIIWLTPTTAKTLPSNEEKKTGGKTKLGAHVPEGVTGVLYLCKLDEEKITVKKELFFLSPYDAYANIPNPESQVVTGKTHKELLIELDILNKNMENKRWLDELRKCI